MLNFIPLDLKSQLGLSKRFTFTHDPSPSVPWCCLSLDHRYTSGWSHKKSSPSWWILPGFASEVHQITQAITKANVPLNQPGWSTRCAKYLLCGQQAQSCGADEPWTNRVIKPRHKRHHHFGIILGCWTEKANQCFQMPRLRVKKLKLAKTRKLSKSCFSLTLQSYVRDLRYWVVLNFIPQG